MKTTINICIDVNIAEKLKSEKNISSLINSYLINYFGLRKQDLITKEEQMEEMNKKKIDIINELSSLDKSITTAKEIIEKEIVTEEKQNIISKEKRSELLKEYEDNIRVFCNVQEDEIMDIALMYEQEKENYDTFFLWCEAKGIKLKELEENA